MNHNEIHDPYKVLLRLWRGEERLKAVEYYRTLDDGYKFYWTRILWSHYGDYGVFEFERILIRVMHPISDEAQEWLDAAANAVGPRSPYTLEEMIASRKRWKYVT